jgi:hypothetical protein
LEIVDIDHLGSLSEYPSIFVVRIDQNDVGHRVVGENGRQEQAHGARFPGAGVPKYGKMLAQQVIDQDKRRLSRVMMERANSDIRTRKWSEDCSQVGVDRSDDGRAGSGVLCDTPPEP